MAKDIASSRRSWRGRRVTIGVQFDDLMPIPPLELRQGKISEEGKNQIKKYIREAKDNRHRGRQVDTVRAVRTSVCGTEQISKQQMEAWGQYLAREIREGFIRHAVVYDNEQYLQQSYEYVGQGFVIPTSENKN